LSISCVLTLPILLPPRTEAQGPPGGDLESRYRAGVDAFQRGDAYRTLELLGGVERQDPTYKEVQKLLGQACLVADLLPAAKDHFEAALEQHPTDGHAAFLLGLALHNAARFVEAIPALDRAHALAPGNPNPLTYRGLSRLRLGEVDAARRDLQAALERAPKDPTSRTALAEIELSTGDPAAAEARVREVLGEHPGSVEARILLGRILFDTGHPGDAVEQFRRALTASPGRNDVLYRLAQALLRSGQTAEGRKRLEDFQTRSRREERIRVLELTVRQSPQNPGPRIELAELLLDHGQPGKALLHLAVLDRQLPRDSRVQSLRRRLARIR